MRVRYAAGSPHPHSPLLPFAVGEDIQRSLPDGEETSPGASASPEKHQLCSPGRAIRSLYPFLPPGRREPRFPLRSGIEATRERYLLTVEGHLWSCFL